MAFVLRILSIVCLQIKTNKNKIQQRASSIDLLRDPGQKKLLPIFIVVFFSLPICRCLRLSNGILNSIIKRKIHKTLASSSVAPIDAYSSIQVCKCYLPSVSTPGTVSHKFVETLRKSVSGVRN